MRVLRYLYYRVYAWNLRMWGESDLPQFNALFGVSVLVYLNILTVLAAIDVLAGRHVVALSRTVAVGMGVTLMVIGYFLLVHKDKYRRIAKELNGETSTQRKKRLIACLLYVALTFVSFFWLASLRNS